jgi:hypothetical protein
MPPPPQVNDNARVAPTLPFMSAPPSPPQRPPRYPGRSIVNPRIHTNQCMRPRSLPGLMQRISSTLREPSASTFSS